MGPMLLGRLVFCVQGRNKRHGHLLAGELRGLFQLPRARPEISLFERPGWPGPRSASLHGESGPAIRVRLLSSPFLPIIPSEVWLCLLADMTIPN